MRRVDEGVALKRLKILLVCSQPSLTCSSLYCLNGMGAEIVAAGDPWMSFLRFSRFCESFVSCDVYRADPDRFARRIGELAHEHHVDIIVPADNDSVLALAAVKDRLDVPVFPIPTPQQLAQLNDKRAFYETCERIGVPVPASVFVSDKHGLDPDELGDRFGYPFIVKPTGRGGSDGLVLVDSAADLRHRVIANDDYRYHPLVAQQFVPGQDVGLNVLAAQGEVLLAAPQMWDGVKIVHLQNDGLVSLGSKYVEAVGLTGLANIDARLGSDGLPTFLECNPRMWSSICHSHWCGENYFAAGVRHALGQPAAAATPIAGRSVTAPGQLLSHIAKGARTPWSLGPYDRRALAQGLADPVLLLRRYFNRRQRGDQHDGV